MLTPILGKATKEQSACLAVPGPGLRSSAFRYTELLAHIPFHDSKLRKKWLRQEIFTFVVLKL